ncbi:MAG: hypothetical protein GY930_08060 [bacterium]|nr:hypothetical protein [bacterium]
MTYRFLGALALSTASLAFAPLALAQAKSVPGTQSASSHLDSLLIDWQADFGPSWHVATNPKTGTAELLYGGRASVGFEPNINNEKAWFRLARHWVGQTRGMHGVHATDLVDERFVFLPLAQVNTTDKVTVALDQIVDGVSVEDGRVNVLFAYNGDLLSLHSTAAPGFEDRSTKASLQGKDAVRAGIAAFVAEQKMAPTHVGEPTLVFAHVDDQETRRWTLSWQVDVQLTGNDVTPVGHLYTVDAHTGAILKTAESVHFFDVNGTIATMATPGTSADRTANPPVQIPVPHLRVTSSAGTVYTDENGAFNFPGVNTPLDITVEYLGNFANSNNDQGADYTTTFSAVAANSNPTLIMNSSPTEFVTAQANAYLSTGTLRDWIRDRIPGDATADFLAPANCNIDSSCNAYFNGSSTNYYNKAGSCNNTAYSVIVAHELGHWLNVRYGTGNGNDGMGEGNADIFALYQYDDAINGRYFFTNGGYVRTGNNTRQFCGDNNPGCYGQVHNDGEVWMGAAWKVRQELNSSLGNAMGDMTADLLFLGWMNAYNQTGIRSIIETQWLTLDDDDGNINNGTPNYAEIDTGFELQGFPGFELSFVEFSNHVPLVDTRDETGPYNATIDMVPVFNPPVASGETLYRSNGGVWSSVPMVNTGGNTWNGAIPGIASPATVDYYFIGTDSLGNTSEFPADGVNNALSFRVGTVSVLLVNDFEGATNEGWTGGVPGDTATTGHWTRGNPVGTSAQPEDDHTVPGDNCWFTGQGSIGGSLGANDVDGGYTTLLSPIFDAGGLSELAVSYWLWYSNNTGASPNNDVFMVSLSGDGGSSWSLVSTVGPATASSNGGWNLHVIELGNVMTLTSNMQLRFVASDFGSGSLVEAALDDIEIVSLAPSRTVIGTGYCSPVVPNSSFVSASITAFGSVEADENDVTLTAFLMPLNKIGIFLNGTAQGFVNPVGSEGNLCVAGAIGRYSRSAGEIFLTGGDGTGSLQLDLNDTPTPTGSIAIMAGETWNFQAWFRDDNPTPTSNFTNAVSVTFQ